MKAILLFIIEVLFLVNIGFAQESFQKSSEKGTISGKVIDGKTGESLPGSTIVIEGTTIGTVGDLDGNYSIKIAEGNYRLTIRMISYTSKTVKDVIVKSGEVTKINAGIEESQGTDLNEIVIEATAKRESVNAMLIQQKNSISVSDGISAEAIKKTPDRNSGDVLKRISGTTIQDNKFAIIRGLNDRYNAVYINGAPLPSTESDRKAFSFDIFPAALLDNITIIKSATPDQPADFAGGIININTRAIPEENSQSISYTSGYNSVTTFKAFQTYQGGKYDALGIDDGTRKLSSELPATEDFRGFNNVKKAETAKLMTNDWALKTKSNTNPASSFQYTIGNTGKVLKNQAGSIFSITYNNNYRISNSIRREFEEQAEVNEPLQIFELKDTEYSNQVLAGALSNLSYKIGSNHQLTLKNMYNVNSEDKVVLRDGIRDFSQEVKTLDKGSVRWFIQNELYTGQLSGEHFIPFGKIKIKWTGGYSDIKRNTPNLRRMLYTKSYDPNLPESEAEPKWEAAIPVSGTSPSAGGNIFYSSNKEKVYSANYDISIPFNISALKNNIRIGGSNYMREREFSARQFGYSRYSMNSSKNKIVFNKDLLFLPEDSIFAAENMGEIRPFQPAANGNPSIKGVGGFKLEEATKLNDSYTASSDLQSGYFLSDNAFKKFRLIWGARIESFDQTLASFEDDGTEVGVDTTTVDILPSANFIYGINAKSNLRLCYSQTVSRPEFRELAPFGFFDFVSFFTVRGNPDLRRAKIYNYDLRYEIYPGVAQIFSVSVFYKKFVDAIEQVNRADVPRELYYQNVPLVNNYGAELEWRINLGSVLNRMENKYLMRTSIFSNVALIKSEVDITKIPGSAADTRPLQGQSPSILNAGAQYSNLEKLFNISCAFNRIGRRIAIVGNIQEPDIYENPRTVLDAQISKTFFNKLELKLNVKDVFAQSVVFYQDLDSNGKLTPETDNVMAETKFGQTVSFGLTFKF